MKICSSHFDAYCEVFSRNAISDGAGGQAGPWASKVFLWVAVDQANANESLNEGGLKTVRRVSFYCNYRTDLLTTDRISLDSVNHNITSITRVDANGKSAYRGKFLRIDTDSSEWFGV
ncbi:MAG: hypothetical protein CO099_06275 [Bdellovibrio sp. CG_4_9_14_3_um_filter_39_7]|nr:MAG: hypothetical protein CO099_06275 [Bdellovibrio sp. CG_4_9_14_3_um_filter_39_7]